MSSFSGVPDKGLSFKPQSLSSMNLSGKSVLIIGGTGGIGRAIANNMASLGAQVTVVGQVFRDQGVKVISFVKSDLSLMSEADRLGREIPVEGLDMVIMTIGIIAAPHREETAEKIERDMAVSYLNRLVLLCRIAPRLEQQSKSGAPKPRIFIMGFPGTGQVGSLDDLNAEKTYKSMDVHMNTVAGNEMLVLDAVKRYPKLGVYGLNPGLIKTNIRSNYLGEGSLKHKIVETMIGLLMTSAEGYAKKIIPVLFSNEIENRSGAMFNQKGIAILPTPALTPERVDAFLNASSALVNKLAHINVG